MYVSVLLQGSEFIMSTLLEYCKGKKSIICYGAGLYGRIVCVFLRENGIKIECFAVTDAADICAEVLEKKVVEINRIADNSDCGIVVCANNLISKEMINKLREKGILDYYVVDDENIGLIDSNCKYVYDYNYKGKGKILLFHRVCELKSDIWKLANSPASFRKQLEYLKVNYNVVSYDELWETDSENMVAITFDDGYADNYQFALPILEELRIPATVFVCTGNIDSDREFWWDSLERMVVCNPECPREINVLGEVVCLVGIEAKLKACYWLREKILFMNSNEREDFFQELSYQTRDDGTQRKTHRSLTSDELRRLDRSPYITIGGHTVTHTRLTSQTYDEQLWEIQTSKHFLEDLLDHPIDCFSYPFGGKTDYDMDTIMAAKSAGYKRVAAVQRRYRKEGMYDYNHSRIGIQGKSSGSANLYELRRAITLGE